MRSALHRRGWAPAVLLVTRVAACGEPQHSDLDGSSAPGDVIAAAGQDARAPSADASRVANDGGEGLDTGPSKDAASTDPDAHREESPDAALAGLDAATPPDASTPDGGPLCAPSCLAGEACLETTCVQVAFSSICGLAHATLLNDGSSVDEAVGSGVAAAVSVACGEDFTVSLRSLADPSAFEASTGRLLTPRSELAFTSGGFYFNPLVAALESSRRSPLYFTSNGSTIGWAASVTNLPVLTFPGSDVSDTHDFFVIELFDDGDGRLLLVDYGIGSQGTQAAGRKVQEMIAAPASYADRWYVYEWVLDADAGGEVTRLVVSGR
ncbi:MAG: hypothetical protein HY901_26150 [Deltaproteobacteria bacterium]|nr:hypothetical protein [Deltaproteobacteria bacterium]